MFRSALRVLLAPLREPVSGVALLKPLRPGVRPETEKEDTFFPERGAGEAECLRLVPSITRELLLESGCLAEARPRDPPDTPYTGNAKDTMPFSRT